MSNLVEARCGAWRRSQQSQNVCQTQRKQAVLTPPSVKMAGAPSRDLVRLPGAQVPGYEPNSSRSECEAGFKNLGLSNTSLRQAGADLPSATTCHGVRSHPHTWQQTSLWRSQAAHASIENSTRVTQHKLHTAHCIPRTAYRALRDMLRCTTRHTALQGAPLTLLLELHRNGLARRASPSSSTNSRRLRWPTKQKSTVCFCFQKQLCECSRAAGVHWSASRSQEMLRTSWQQCRTTQRTLRCWLASQF